MLVKGCNTMNDYIKKNEPLFLLTIYCVSKRKKKLLLFYLP